MLDLSDTWQISKKTFIYNTDKKTWCVKEISLHLKRELHYLYIV